MMRILFFLAAIALLGAAPNAYDPAPYMHAQRLVNIGGRTLNLYCTGSGSPTVILDTDGDDSTLGWALVQPWIARRTRVCSYDSAGLGFSDPGPLPRDASAMAEDLHALVKRAGIGPPLVLVGYSLSGMSVRLYADRHRHDVAGMVLVAPNVPYQRKLLAAAAPALAPVLTQVLPYDRSCYAAAVKGTMRPGTQAFANCMYTPPGPPLTVGLRALIQQQWQKATTWQDFMSADEAADGASSREVTREQRSYRDMPLIVLTTVKDQQSLRIPEAQRRALVTSWIATQDRTAALSSRGINFVVSNSSQSIPIDRPFAVISAINAVVDQARYTP